MDKNWLLNRKSVSHHPSHSTQSHDQRLRKEPFLIGYTDWFLPSKDELNKLRENKLTIGGFANMYYWSSTELGGGTFAWGQDFGIYLPTGFSVFNKLYVRAVRAF